MIKRIVVGADGSPWSETAVDYALHLGRVCDAEVEAVFVPDVRLAAPPLPPADLLGAPLDISAAPLIELQAEERKRGDAILARVLERARGAEVRAVSVRETGLPDGAIAERARGADLVCLGKLGRSHEGRDAASVRNAGGTVRAVAGRAVRPLLIAPRTFRPIRRVLVAYDGSDHASRALRAAVELAEVVSPAEPPAYEVVSIAATEEEARGIAAVAVTYFRAHAVHPTVRAVAGKATDREILRAADESGADIIVAGAFGEHPFRDLFVGSTMLEVLRVTSLPVLLHH